MKSIYKYILVCIASLGIGSCNYLDVVPDEFVTEGDVWSSIDLTERAIARLYNVLPSSWPYEMWAANSNAKNHWEKPPVWAYNNGSWGPTNIPEINRWAGRYRDVRRATLILQNIDGVPIPEYKKDYYEARIPRYKAEVRLLRVFFYFDLFRMYGAIPLIKDDEMLNPEDIDKLLAVNMPRASVDEVVEYLVAELDDIENELPETYPDAEYGRVTRGAVYAMKSRVTLYAASALLNGCDLYKDVKNLDGKKLFPQAPDSEKWLDAADAAEKLMNMEGTYNLAYSNNPTNYVLNYAEQFYDVNFDELVFFRTMPASRDLDLRLFPNGTNHAGFGKYSISQELVDCYEMATTGLPITDVASGYTETGFWSGQMWDGLKMINVSNVSNMYKDRDPRFYATVFFHNSVWRYEKTKSTPLCYAYWGNNNGVAQGWPKSGTNCESGYNIRKWCSPNVDLVAKTGNSNRYWIIFRFAEAYLNYAEAMNEYLDVPDARVYNAINKVRDRVGLKKLPITAADATKEGMRARIRNERRVEFAFEDHWFWDVRRWMIAAGPEGVENTPIHGLNAQPTTAELVASGYGSNTREAGEAVFYKRVKLHDRVFEDKHYLFPIPQDELDRAPYLIQNYGWEKVILDNTPNQD